MAWEAVATGLFVTMMVVWGAAVIAGERLLVSFRTEYPQEAAQRIPHAFGGETRSA